MIRVGVTAGASVAFHLAVFAAAGSGGSSVQMPRNSAEIRIGHPPGQNPAEKARGGQPELQPASMRAPDPPQPVPIPTPASRPEPDPKPVKPKSSPIAQVEPEPLPADIPDEPPAPTQDRTEARTTSDIVDNGSPTSQNRNSGDGPDGSLAGNTGNKSGTDDGARDAVDNPSNAASTNYAGLVMQHLSKVRRPRASGPGSAFVSFTIGFQGQLEELHIAKSSRSARFDRDALKVVRRATPFPVPPPGVNRSFSVEIEGN
ncbi:MAG: TonB family protein [Hyphomonas sp.]